MAPWADEPFALIPTTKSTNPKVSPEICWVADDMTNAHNCFLRCLNSKYLQAPFVTKQPDIDDLLNYALFWDEGIHHHHDGEEAHLFPAWAEAVGEPDLMKVNVEQHDIFIPGIKAFKEYCLDCLNKDNATQYEANEFRKKIDAFAPDLVAHLRDEIDTLIALDRFDGKLIKKTFLDCLKKLIEGADKNTMFPMVLGSNDNGYKGSENFPEIPFFLKYMVHYIFERKHRGVWRFNPSNTWGKPKPLYFIPQNA